MTKLEAMAVLWWKIYWKYFLESEDRSNMSKTLDGLQKYYECTECGCMVSAGEIQAHELFDCSSQLKSQKVGEV